jgi:hypothetical protein
MGLNAVGFAMVGLIFGLSHWILYCSGIRACPTWWSKQHKPEDLIPEQTIGAMGSLAAAISLLFMAYWHQTTDPFGALGASGWSVVFTLVPAIFGFLFLGLAITAYKGLDWRPIGDAALTASLITFVVLVYGARQGIYFDVIIVLVIWAFLAGSMGLVINGKLGLKIFQLNLVLSAIGAFWLMLFYGGLYTTTAAPGNGGPAILEFVTDNQDALTNDEWFYLWVIVGVINLLMLAWNYKNGPKKAVYI